MSIITNQTRQKIWDALISSGCSTAGAAGIMGNLHSQSMGCIPNRVEGLLIQRYKEEGFHNWPYGVYNDQTSQLYTKEVDEGTITKEEFLSPRQYTKKPHQYGYGLAQWTTKSRKERLWSYTRAKGKSISDIEGQIECLVYELKNLYPSVWNIVSVTNSVNDASDIVLIKFEAPANANNLKTTRRGYSNQYYTLYKNRKQKKEQEIKEEVINMDFSLYYGKISNSGFNESGAYNGGAAGDQTGHEWEIKNWYNRPWNQVLRHPKREVRQKIAELAIKAAKNNNIGYEDGSRQYYPLLKAAGYDPSKITTKTESDCSKGVLANVKAVGFLLNNKQLQAINENNWTGNMSDDLVKHGFKKLTASKYLTGTDYLLPGDILLLAPGHTCTNIGIGKYAYKEVDYLQKGFQGETVKTLQENLKKAGYYTGSKIDGVFGAKTEESLIKFKKAKKLNQQTIYGPVTKEALEKEVKAKSAATATAAVTSTISTKAASTSSQSLGRKVTADQILSRAAAYIGYEQKKSNANLEDFHANAGSNNYQKFQPLANAGNGDQWCQYFVDGIFVDTAGSIKGAQQLLCMSTSSKSMTGYTPQGKQYFVDAKRWYTTPKRGDVIYFYSSSKGRVGHTGLVEKVDTSKKIVYTIEGNTSGTEYSENGGCVARHSYSYASIGGKNRVNGFGRPKYEDAIINTPAKPMPNSKTNTSSTKDANGITINTSGTYSETRQAYGTVNVAWLNIRKGPGAEYLNLVSYPVLPQGYGVQICDAVKANTGKIWYFIKIKGNKGQKFGFASSEYIKVNK